MKHTHSVFGKVGVMRPYFYKAGSGSSVPLDAKLGLGERSYSDMLQQMETQLSVYVPYDKAGKIITGLLGQTLSTRMGQQCVLSEAVDVEAFYEQLPVPDPVVTATILVGQADGKGVPMRQKTAAAAKVRLGKGEKRSCKKEAVVTTVYTIAPKQRTAEQVVASLFNEPHSSTPQTPQPPQPQHKRTWATLEGKHTAMQRLQRQAEKLDNPHITHRVTLSDGDPALQDRLTTYLPQHTLILDIIHLSEYLWKVANALWRDDELQRLTWVNAQLLALLRGQAQSVLATLSRLSLTANPSQLAVIDTTSGYLQRNLPYLHYDLYLAAGFPIASGAIEGACRHLVKDRMELSGMRWQPSSANSLFALRAVSENDDWSAFHLFHQQQRQLRLYAACPSSVRLSAFHSLPLAG